MDILLKEERTCDVCVANPRSLVVLLDVSCQTIRLKLFPWIIVLSGIFSGNFPSFFASEFVEKLLCFNVVWR